MKITISLKEEEYTELMMHLGRNYLIDAKKVLAKIKERGDIKVE